MSTLHFPDLLLKKEIIKKLLAGKGESKGFKRVCLQFYHNEVGGQNIMTLIAHPVDSKREPIEMKMFPLEQHGDLKDAVKAPENLILGQFELSNKQLRELSDDCKRDLIFKARSFRFNPFAIVYDVNRTAMNPSPPAPPPAEEMSGP